MRARIVGLGVVRATPQCSLSSLLGPERLGNSDPILSIQLWAGGGQDPAQGLVIVSQMQSYRPAWVLATWIRQEKTRCSLIRLQRIPPDAKTVCL